MASYTKVKLSASANGRGVQLTAIDTPGTAVHTATSAANEMDEVWLWAQNHRASQEDLVVEFGGTASGDRIEQGLPPQAGLIPVVAGLVVSGGVSIAAFCDVASGVSIFGYVNRINQS